MTDIQRWTREVAEDPGAHAFVRLARAYRRQGRRAAARNVVLRGLERNPEHLGGHALLAVIHVEEGDRQLAEDEWETVMRLDPDNFDASRGLGFLALERGELDVARRHLDNAARMRPDDPVVAEARQVLSRLEGGDRTPPADRVGREDGGRAPERDWASGTGTPVGGRDPVHLFDKLTANSPFLGAVVLDAQGLVLAGSLDLGEARAELLGAILNTAVAEARRTTELLGLGAWDGLLMDCADATLHVSALDDETVVLLAAGTDAPAGWIVRTAERARELARSFMEVTT